MAFAPPPGGGAGHMAGRKMRIKTSPFSHHGLAFSPFFEDRLAVASGANFGLVGNGRLHVLGFGGPGGGGGIGVIKM